MSYNLLKGKKGIIFGALDERSIAWRTALRCHEEGAEIVLSNAPVAMRMGEINKLAEIVNAPVIACDVSSNHGAFWRGCRFYPAFHRHEY